MRSGVSCSIASAGWIELKSEVAHRERTGRERDRLERECGDEQGSVQGLHGRSVTEKLADESFRIRAGLRA